MSRPRYSILPADCLDDPRFKDVHLRVLVKLGSHTDNRGWCEVNQKKLGEACGKSRETVNRAIRDLCEMGYLMKRDQTTKANGRTISQYRVLMDRPDPAPDVDPPVTQISQGVVTPEDHSPCDVATSQHNDLSSNDHPSLRSDSERVDFDEVWEVYPRRRLTNRRDARKAFDELSIAERVRLLIAAKRFAQWHIEDSDIRNATPESQVEFRMGLGKWIRSGAWIDALTVPLKSDPAPASVEGWVYLPPRSPRLPGCREDAGQEAAHRQRQRQARLPHRGN
ncbi:helix-turn-helix domain-containing protein [Devosia ginsengisoli]|uniref:Helix-turn-helix domain-containing protein n=1 Tax=Devosia ginsengisoli TaxID=400770 RepID=A0A5B8LQL6_9HYPH|nr:helix-turn-helix domain-containing protein [Devosia ginsengisoli]QDZ10538.1 helix-turn-helix domain-containing protein [Devosia ginsengisoli]